MDYDKEKVDEFTLALLYLVTWERQEGCGARVWTGFDWGTRNRAYPMVLKEWLWFPRISSFETCFTINMA